jgi:lipid II:glycine glycyltransferase (peptidoglycan interpeptide bridge formation enzyme)
VTSVVSAASTAPADWDDLVVNPTGGHVLQSRAWAEHRADQGWQPRFVTFDDGRGALLLTRRQRPIPGSAAYTPRGPISAGDPAEAVAGRAIALARWARGNGVRVLTVDPELSANPEYDSAIEAVRFKKREEIQASRHRMLVPLPPGSTEDTLLANMSKSARQRIRAAEQAGTVIAEDPAGDDLPELARMLGEAAETKQFSVGRVGALISWWRRVLSAGHARFWVARSDGVPVGGLLAYQHGGHLATAYSADDRARRAELPGTMHLLRWMFLRTALERSDTFADLGGVDVAGARRVPQEGEPTYGLYEHKRSLGAVWTESAAAHEIVLRPTWQRVAEIAARVRGG